MAKTNFVMVTVNKQKLDKKEYNILKKIANKLFASKYSGQTMGERRQVIDFVKSELNTSKLLYNMEPEQALGDRYVVCYLNIGEQMKTCHLLFDKFKKCPPLLIPSGVFELNDSSSM